MFQVNRVWKGQVPETFEMGHLGADSCDGFSSLDVGSEWIVYGHGYWPDSDYFPLACNTDLVERAKDIQKLGPGRTPNAK
jgi:hypothetical protein